jgi:hypothetical protein
VGFVDESRTLSRLFGFRIAAEDVMRMRMIPVRTISEALDQAGSGEGFIMPRGAAVLPRIEAQ